MIKKILLLNASIHIDFKNYKHDLNISRIKIMTKIIFMLEAMMLVLTYLKPNFFSETHLTHYRLHYVFLLAMALCFMAVTFMYNQKKLKSPTSVELIINISVAICLLWGVSLTRLDLLNGGFITVYLTFLFMLSGIVIMTPVVALVIMSIGHVGLLLAAYSHVAFMEIALNGTIFFIFAWVLTRQQYWLILQKFSRTALIEEKNEILEKQNQELIRLTMVDHLTGMYNRYSLEDVLSKKWLEAYVNQKLVLALMIDIDYFKQINDTYGHIAGDKSLVLVAEVFDEFVTRYDGYGFRYGGDEFCLIFYDPVSVEGLVENLSRAVDNIFVEVREESIPVTMTIGSYAEVPKDLENIWGIIDEADKVLYQKKSSRKRRKQDIENGG